MVLKKKINVFDYAGDIMKALDKGAKMISYRRREIVNKL